MKTHEDLVFENSLKNMKRWELYPLLIGYIKDGMKITFTKFDVAEDDNFLIFGCGYDSCTVTFHTNRVPYWIGFDNDEPMRLEDVPTSFIISMLINLKKM